jgi:hypothetical protein
MILFQSRFLLKLISRSSVGLGESTQYERYDVLVQSPIYVPHFADVER